MDSVPLKSNHTHSEKSYLDLFHKNHTHYKKLTHVAGCFGRIEVQLYYILYTKKKTFRVQNFQFVLPTVLAYSSSVHIMNTFVYFREIDKHNT